MKLHFQIDYYTHFGELLQLSYTLDGATQLPLALRTDDGHTWYGQLLLPDTGKPLRIAYSYRVVDDAGKTLRDEAGQPRRILLAAGHDAFLHDAWMDKALPEAVAAFSDRRAVRRDTERPYGGAWRAAGVVVPVFALRSKGSWGIGDFGDLASFTSWAASAGMQCVQILPINDTTTDGSAADSYPYNAVSVFALNPLYLDAREFSETDAYRHFQAEGEALNASPVIAYEDVARVKYRFLAALCAELQSTLIRTAAYRDFLKENAEWIDAYSTYFDRTLEQILRSYGDVKHKAVQRVGKLAQYLLHGQMQRAHSKAQSLGVLLKGDIPIGVNPRGVDATQHPELFHFDGTAGAPPDAFAADGQNWGFPTYNWERMARDGYAWWRSRIQNMERYFDAYRIDHVLGFFRIWEIPVRYTSGRMGHFRPALPYKDYEISSFPRGLFLEVDGAFHPRIDAKALMEYETLSAEARGKFDALYEDFFFHRHNDFWADEGKKRLRALTAGSRLLPCAEDLGMVPACVPSTLRDLGILSLEIRRMPKQVGRTFSDIWQNPYLSVSTIATHDMPPLRLWWQTEPDAAAEFWHGVWHRGDSVPAEADTDVCTGVVCEHLASPSMLALIALQDLLAMDEHLRAADPATEQINVPANPRHRWTYRMHLCIEELQAAETFTQRLRRIVESYGR